MSIYDVDYGRKVIELLPVDKRNAIHIKWLLCLFTPISWLRTLLFDSYRTGSVAPNYAPGTYNKYNQVIYRQSVYMSLFDGNAEPVTNTSAWIKIQDNFLGAEQRVLYNGQLIVLEYALNQWFRTQFRQPPNRSDIYITVHQKATPAFVVGSSEANSSKVGDIFSTEFITNQYSFLQYYNMTINMPIAVWTSLDTVVLNRDKFVRSYADQFIIAGITYNISTY